MANDTNRCFQCSFKVADRNCHIHHSSLTCVSHVPHRVLKGPDDGVQDQFELGRGNGQEGCKTLGGGSLEEVEEMSSVFWEFFKVLTKEGKVQAVTV